MSEYIQQTEELPASDLYLFGTGEARRGLYLPPLSVLFYKFKMRE